MNERIRKLGVEAGLYVDLNGAPWPRAMSAEECELAYTKFAELVVRECIQVGGPEDSYTDEWFKAKADSVGKIKQHFGVDNK
jgi:hypothetical protein